MKKILFMFVLILGVSVFFSNYVMAADNEVGTFALIKIKDGLDEVLYKVNTKTGKVWCYSGVILLKAEDLRLTGKEATNLNKLIAQAY